MNEIIVRTDKSDYTGGSTIYGAVYLRLLQPVVADSVAVSISATESCCWKKIKPVARTRSTSQNSNDTGFSDGSEPNSADISFQEVMFSGHHKHLQNYYRLKRFEDGGVIPLGCYAFPFQISLPPDLPNSFKKENTFDEVKRTTYKAEIRYQITAMLRNSSSRSESDVQCNHTVVLRNEGFMKRSTTNRTETIRQPIKACCFFNKGDISLTVTLDKVMFTLGETIGVKFQIENKSNVSLSTARIKLLRTVILKGERSDDEGKAYVTNEAFPEEFQTIVPLEMGTSKSKSFNIPIKLEDKGEAVVTTAGCAINCRHHLEVELDIPLDVDISVFIPIEVYPNASEYWVQWVAPEWIRDVQVVNADGVCAVARHMLESTEFAKIPLPLAGLQ